MIIIKQNLSVVSQLDIGETLIAKKKKQLMSKSPKIMKM